jgi:DegV family protein with EDD domain
VAKVAIVTDSAASLPEALAGEYSIHVVPLSLVLDGRTYADSLDDGHEFYRHLRSASRPPTTTSPSPGTYVETMRKLARQAPSILCVTVGSQFSVTYQSALRASELLREGLPDLELRVLDSQAAAMAQGFMVLAAARTAAKGGDLAAAVASAEALMPRVRILAALDTLEFLARGGRVHRVAAWASDLLQVKPIVEFKQRQIDLVARTRTRRRAINRLLSLLEARCDPGKPLHACVQHTDAPDEAQALAERVSASLHPVELYVQEFTRAMGVHTGPGLLAVSFYSEP